MDERQEIFNFQSRNLRKKKPKMLKRKMLKNCKQKKFGGWRLKRGNPPRFVVLSYQ